MACRSARLENFRLKYCIEEKQNIPLAKAAGGYEIFELCNFLRSHMPITALPILIILQEFEFEYVANAGIGGVRILYRRSLPHGEEREPRRTRARADPVSSLTPPNRT